MASTQWISRLTASWFAPATFLGLALALSSVSAANGEASEATSYAPIPPSLTTPDTVETSLGTLDFRDGIPSEETAQKLYDQLDLQRGVESYLNGLRGVSIYAAR